MALRHEKPLPQFLDRDSGLSVNGSIPNWKLDPRVLGYKLKHSRATNIPGIESIKTIINLVVIYLSNFFFFNRILAWNTKTTWLFVHSAARTLGPSRF